MMRYRVMVALLTLLPHSMTRPLAGCIILNWLGERAGRASHR
jgi:hypothetical protein